MRNFKELRIWQKGVEIVVECFRTTANFPKEQRFELSPQITRSGVSIPSNIAEGSSRSSGKDYARFLEISLGSCFELETQLIIAQKAGIGLTEEIDKVLFEIQEEQKMITGLYNKLMLRSKKASDHTDENQLL